MKRSQKNEKNQFTEELLWHVVKSYISQKKFFTNHHIDSYNYFIEKEIPNFLKKEYVFYIQHYQNTIYRNYFEFKNIKYEYINDKDKLLTPEIALQNDLTYEIQLSCTIIQKQDIIDINTNETQTKELFQNEIIIGNVPIMVYSNICVLNKEKYITKDSKYNNGGYFIVKGNEKICVTQERLVYNRVYIFNKLVNNIIEYSAEVNSQYPDNKYKSSNIKIIITKNNIITVSLPFLNNINLPVILLLYLCGIESDKEIFSMILLNSNKDIITEYINPLFKNKGILNKKLELINDTNKSINVNNIYNDLIIHVKENLININSKNNINYENNKLYIQSKLKNDLLPHLGSNLIKKAKYICYMINRLLLTKIGVLQTTDRDSYIHKRLETSGIILSNNFWYSFNAMIDNCKKLYSKRIQYNLYELLNPVSAIEYIKSDIFNSEFKVLLSVGFLKSFNKKGIFNKYDISSYINSISHTRQVRTTIGSSTKSSKLVEPRLLHNTQFGYICPVETPEGEKVGFIKYLANTTSLTIHHPQDKKNLINILSDLIIDINIINPYDLYKNYRVFLDGDWIGLSEDIFALKDKLIKLRRDKLINSKFSINIKYELMELIISTDYGRLIRPLLIVEDNKIVLPSSYINSKLSWNEYIKNNYVEFLDVEESYSSTIALNYKYIIHNNELIKNTKIYNKDQIIINNNKIKKYTHCEIHSLCILGICTSCNPFQNHNQAPKNTSSCKYIKQSVGIFNPSFNQRFDTNSKILHYPQLPIVNTKMHDIIKLNELPTGQNAIVALGCYSGYNQEDSLIVNKSAIERGLFNISSYVSYKSESKKNNISNKNDIFIKPHSDKVSNIKKSNYDLINNQGIIKEEELVTENDVIIGKISDNVIGVNNKQYIDSSTILKKNDKGRVDKVLTKKYNSSNNEICKVKIRDSRPIFIGDKLCYDVNTEILTNKGWKYLKNLTFLDKIAILDNNILKYDKPLEIFEYDYNGPMIELQNRYCNYCITPNHKLYVKNKDNNKFILLSAETLYRKSKIFKTGSYYNGSKSFKTNYRLYLHGLLISEGLFIKKQIYTTNTEIIDLCKKLNIKYKQKNNNYIIKLVDISELFPSWIWNINSTKIKFFINGLYNKKNIFTTTNSKLVNNIQRIIIHAGYHSKLYINKNNYNIQLIKSNTYYRQNSNSEKYINYNDKIYCCTSQSGVICVRRNGITMWNGNSSRHGQKGTVGIVLNQEDMPFTKDGIIPDIIMNPHSIPTRMSMGQILDCILGKIGSIEGHTVDGTTFNNIDTDNFSKILIKYGFDESGEEEMRCGLTGNRLSSKIFIGPTYYQRLSHMVQDKIHIRSGTGPLSLLTRLPPRGRARLGGFKIGEMERDCFIAHGISQYLKEKLIESGDKYNCKICSKCGVIAHNKKDFGYYICQECKDSKYISNITIPYNFKLLIQELNSIGIKIQLKLEEDQYNYRY